MAKDLTQFNPFEAMRRYTNIIGNTQEKNGQHLSNYLEAKFDEIYREHPEYFTEGIKQEEAIKGISRILAEKINKRLGEMRKI